MERLAAADARASDDTSPAAVATASSDDDDAGQHARWALDLTTEMDEHLSSLRVEQREGSGGAGGPSAPSTAVEGGRRRRRTQQHRARRSKKAPEEPSSLVALAASEAWDGVPGADEADHDRRREPAARDDTAAAQRVRTNAPKLNPKLKAQAARGRGKAARRSQASLARKRLGLPSPMVAAPPAPPPAHWSTALPSEAPQPRHAPPPPPSPPSSPLPQIAARGPRPLRPPSPLPLHRLEVAGEAAAAEESHATIAELKLRAAALRRMCADDALPEEARALRRDELAACKRAMRCRVAALAAERGAVDGRGAAAAPSAPPDAPLGLRPAPPTAEPVPTEQIGAAEMRAAMRAQQLHEARAHRGRCAAALAEFGSTLGEYTSSAPRSGGAPPLATVAKRTVQRKRAVRVLSQSALRLAEISAILHVLRGGGSAERK
jgi:hypothetical protein